MADNWNLRGKTQMLDDLNTPSLQCRVYDRIAVQDSKGKTHFYCLELSAGNTFDFGFCRKENVPSLLRDVMTMGSIRVLSGICDDLMVPTVPTVLWLKQARKYDPKHVIMWLENSIELTEEYKDTILRLRKMGMRFAVRVDAMGEIASNDEILACIDYLMVDFERSAEFMTVIQSLRNKNPLLKTIAFKHHISIFSFNKEETRNFDYVLGTVNNFLLTYENERPKWQHEMLRTFAQLYSSINDVKEIGVIVANYPLMALAMKGMVASKHLTNLTIRKNSSTLGESQTLTQFDLRNFLAISVGYNLFTLTEKQSYEQKKIPFSSEFINYEPFIQALNFAKIVDLMAQDICDDITAPQAFIAGFLRFAHVFLHDTEEATFAEFPLDAVVSCYTNGGGQLGSIIRILMLLFEHRINDAMDVANNAGLVLVKDRLYGYISHAMAWTDAVCCALNIIKGQQEE